MKAPAIPIDEDARIRALLEECILDTPPESFLDACVAFAARACGVSTGAVTLVDRERQWFKAVFGKLPSETPRAVSFCGHVVAEDAPLVVPDAKQDPRFSDNPLVLDGIRFYAGVPLYGRDGHALGTLCVIDSSPREIGPGELEVLRLIADKIEEYLSLRLIALRVAKLEAEARREVEVQRQLEARRQQAVAMMVHDIKAPLAAVTLTLDVLMRDERLPMDVRADLASVLESAEAASHLVVDSLDLSKLDGGNVPIARKPCDLGEVVARMVRRARHQAEERKQQIVVRDALGSKPVAIDSALVTRALRNYIDNSLKYAPEGRPVVVELCDAPESEAVLIRVVDEGAAIPMEHRARIFEPHYRIEGEPAEARPSHGLGLAVCKAVARAHGGDAWVEPAAGNDAGNAFCMMLRVA